jgi:ribosomal protein S18 acetylase RimI-like enzyme
VSDYAIRRAAAADLDALGRLGAMLMHAHYSFDGQRFMRPGAHAEEGYASFLATQLDDPESLVLVAARNDSVVGYLYGAVEPPSWKELRDRAGFIHDILVDAPSRRFGIADALLEEAIRWLREQRVPRVILWTAAPNDQAQRLFARKGFRTTMHEMTLELQPPE